MRGRADSLRPRAYDPEEPTPRTCLGETEDVVDKQEDILAAAILVAELLRDGKTGKSHTQTRARRLVHLSEHEGGLGLCHFDPCLRRQDSTAVLHAILNFSPYFITPLDHLTEEVVAPRVRSPTPVKHREAVVAFGDVVDKLHDEHGLSHAGATEQADLSRP